MAFNWKIELQGLDKVINKLSKLQNMDMQQILEQVAQEGTRVVQSNTASAGFPNSSQAVGVYNKSKNFLDIGYSNNFKQWAPLWYHTWGYRIHYKGRDGKTHYNGKTYTLHIGCWDNIRHLSIEQIKPVLERKAREYLRQQINS